MGEELESRRYQWKEGLDGIEVGHDGAGAGEGGGDGGECAGLVG